MKLLANIFVVVPSIALGAVNAQNHEICYVCGDASRTVGVPMRNAPIPPIPENNIFEPTIELTEVTCGQVEFAGMFGLLPPALCLLVNRPLIQTFCQCIDKAQQEEESATIDFSDKPSNMPSDAPSLLPSDMPSDMPSLQPGSTIPSDAPSMQPSMEPTKQPKNKDKSDQIQADEVASSTRSSTPKGKRVRTRA